MTHLNEYVVSGDTVADLMCGTASVARSLKEANYRVIASDIMTYAIHHARVRLLCSTEPAFFSLGLSYQEVLDFLNKLHPIEGHFFKEYCPDGHPLNGSPPRKYFSTANACKVDAISEQISDWYKKGELTELLHSLLRHDLILAANRVANIAGTYGHYRSSLDRSSQTPISLIATIFSSTRNNDHLVIKGRAEDLADCISADLCYIDPPYKKRQYAANYHILETLARGDKPEAIGKSGLRPWRDQYSNFCSRVKIRKSFDRIFNACKCRQFLISYSDDGLLSESEFSNFLSNYGNLTLFKTPYRRFKSNPQGNGGLINELLYHLKR